MEELVEQFARVAGSFVEAVTVLLRGLVNRIARIWVHPKIVQS